MKIRGIFVALAVLIGALATSATAQDVLGSQPNYNACLYGHEGQCNLLALTPSQFAEVQQAALGRNLTTCLFGGTSCNAALLTVDQRTELAAKGKAAAATSATATSTTTPPPATRVCAENGSCYGDVSAATGRPKTVHVGGYTRKDGTYVRGHYRSKKAK